MKRNRFLNMMLLAALVFGLGVTSCKDDNNISEEQQQTEQEAAREEKASKFWDVVGQIVSMDDYTEDFQGKTFEPILGTEDELDPMTRIVATNTPEAAASRYASLIGNRDITAATTSHEWSDPEVGSLSYRKVTDGTAWAEVEVNIPAVPHLTKIIFRSATQGNTNGGVKNGGRAYYRFGDVVSRKNADGMQEYWVCVRPAFDKEGKGDTHWMSVSPLPTKNIWSYTGSNKRVYKLPTGLSTSEEQMKNMAEMLFAICYPGQWQHNLTNYHPTFFHDFDEDSVKYHNQFFWQNVQDGWKDQKVAEKLFGKDKGLDWFTENLTRNGLYLLYKGKEWNTWTSNGPTLFQAHFVDKPRTKYCNMRTPDSEAYTKVFHNVIDKKNPANDIDFNVVEECTLDYPYIVKNAYFGDSNPRWIVRHAYGKELSKTGKYANNQFPIEGVEEVYRYYRDVNPCIQLDQAPEESYDVREDIAEAVFNMRGYYDIGDVVADSENNRWFCILPSGHGSGRTEIGEYAYFISYDAKAVGAELQNIPSSKELAMQVTFCLENLFHNTLAGDKKGGWYNRVQNIQDFGGVMFSEIVGCRDSIVTHKGNIAPSEEKISFISTIYRENGQLYVLRTVGDYTQDQESGGRDWCWDFWTRYTRTTPSERKMLLSDLADQNIINQYNEDKWVRCKWYNTVTKEKVSVNTGVRTEPEEVTPRSLFIYHQGYYGSWMGYGPSNMYREPLYAFAVKRVKDLGKRATTFEDGTPLRSIRLTMERDANLADDDPSVSIPFIVIAYADYVEQHRLFCDGVPYDFGLKNRP